MNFNPFSDIYHSLWDVMTCRGIEGCDVDVTCFGIRGMYDASVEYLKKEHSSTALKCLGTFEYYSYWHQKVVERDLCQQHSLALNPTAAQLKKRPYHYIITEVMIGDCDES